jgi:hypothetical protein
MAMIKKFAKTACPWCCQPFDLDLGEIGAVKPCPNCQMPVQYAPHLCREIDAAKFQGGPEANPEAMAMPENDSGAEDWQESAASTSEEDHLIRQFETTSCPWCCELFDMDLAEVGNIGLCPNCQRPVEYARQACREVNEFTNPTVEELTPEAAMAEAPAETGQEQEQEQEQGQEQGQGQEQEQGQEPVAMAGEEGEAGVGTTETTSCPWCCEEFNLDLGEVGKIKPCPNCRMFVEYARQVCREVDKSKAADEPVPNRAGTMLPGSEPFAAEERETPEETIEDNDQIVHEPEKKFCPWCGQPLDMELEEVGDLKLCPNCQAPVGSAPQDSQEDGMASPPDRHVPAPGTAMPSGHEPGGQMVLETEDGTIYYKKGLMIHKLEKTFCPWCRQLFDLDLEEIGEIKPCPNCHKPLEYARKTCRKVDVIKFKHGKLPRRTFAEPKGIDPYANEERKMDASAHNLAEPDSLDDTLEGLWKDTRELTSVSDVFRIFLIYGFASVALHVAAKLFITYTSFIPAGSEGLLWWPFLLWYLFFLYAVASNHEWRWFGIAWLIFGGGTAIVALGLSQLGLLDVRHHGWQVVPIALVGLAFILFMPFTRKYIPYLFGVIMAGMPVALTIWILAAFHLFWP